MSIAGNLLTNWALILAPVAMVYLVGTFQPFVVLCFSFICAKFFQKVVNESFSPRTVIPKIVAILIMLLGSLFLFI